MVTVLDFLMVPFDGVGSGLHVGELLWREIEMMVDPVLGLFLGPPDIFE